MKNCAEILLLGLVQASSQWSVIQLEILSLLLPTFLSNHPVSHAILNNAWHDPSPRAQVTRHNCHLSERLTNILYHRDS